MLDLYLNTEDKDNPLFLLGKTGDEWGCERIFSEGF